MIDKPRYVRPLSPESRGDGVDLREWNDTLAVNLSGPMLCCRKALKHLAEGASIAVDSGNTGL